LGWRFHCGPSSSRLFPSDPVPLVMGKYT
jgi:hypothetical protein